MMNMTAPYSMLEVLLTVPEEVVEKYNGEMEKVRYSLDSRIHDEHTRITGLVF